MSTLAQQGHRVLFIENTGVRRVTLEDLSRLKRRLLNWRKGVRGIRKIMDNLYVYAPLVLPFPYSRTVRALNKALMTLTLRSWVRTMQFENPIIWTWLPTGLSLELIRVLGAQLVIYYCADNFAASSANTKGIRKTEDILIRTADLVFATSKALFDRCSQLTTQAHIFPYGFNREVFRYGVDFAATDLESIKRPILGYVGGVHKFIDFDLVEKVALAHPDKSLVFVGPLQTDVGRLADLPNVHFLGQKKYEVLPAYIKHFDLCLIPYVENEYTRNVYPTKMNEYLFMGKPVVSTQLPEVEYFNQCHRGIVLISESHEAFLLKVEEALGQSTNALTTQRIRVAEGNAWDKKIDAMQRLIQGKLEEKTKTRELNWQQTLSRVYRTSRRKLAVVATACCLAFFLVFYTPMVWFLAEPLKIVNSPVPSDVIVVLAGGIGESGEPGEEYREKVQRGEELYRSGYADWLIFSSGATYVFKEARVMEALAVSLGIPGDKIILDEVGGGNYSSFLNIKRIMEDHGWTRILLVTSLYNGTRSKFVAEKKCPHCLPLLSTFPCHSSLHSIQKKKKKRQPREREKCFIVIKSILSSSG